MSEKSIFSRIIDREIPSEIVFEDDRIIAIKDIAPQAPVHVLVVPKVPCRDFIEADTGTIVALMEGCKEVAGLLGLVESGFRVIINTGKGGGQTVFHLHAHIMGGAPLEWEV
jgi:histidine triad (HIT) family protein